MIEIGSAAGRPDAVITVRPTGRLDLAGAASLRGLLLKVLAQAPRAVLVDMSGLVVPDAVHLTVLPAVCAQADAWPGCRLILFNASPAVTRALRSLRLDEHFALCEDAAHALAAARRPSGVGSWLERLAPERDAPARGRRAVDRCCELWGVTGSARASAALICSELVTNGVRHAGTSLELLLRSRARYLHVAVRDFSPDTTVGPVRPGPPASGLGVVAAVAAGWGVTPTSDGKVVWATVRRDPGVPDPYYRVPDEAHMV